MTHWSNQLKYDPCENALEHLRQFNTPLQAWKNSTVYEVSWVLRHANNNARNLALRLDLLFRASRRLHGRPTLGRMMVTAKSWGDLEKIVCYVKNNYMPIRRHRVLNLAYYCNLDTTTWSAAEDLFGRNGFRKIVLEHYPMEYLKARLLRTGSETPRLVA